MFDTIPLYFKEKPRHLKRLKIHNLHLSKKNDVTLHEEILNSLPIHIKLKKKVQSTTHHLCKTKAIKKKKDIYIHVYVLSILLGR